jgi:ABC-type nitrate/sulfonate/bicarbonate transport system ATPase subunit
MIQFEHVDFGYRREAPIFKDFNWCVEKGEAWAVLGPSGCGKSTLLSLLAGLLKPDAGSVWVDGLRLVRPRPHTGLIIQDFGLLPWATVRENAALGLQVRNFYGPDGTHAPREHARDVKPQVVVEPWLQRLGLAEVADQYPARISGGQRQRTAIARTLALQPDVLLMDEPFSSLDALTRTGLQRLTLELWREANLTLVIVTHAIEEAAVLGEHILLLGTQAGKAGSQPEMIANPGARDPNFRDSGEYQEVCRLLRSRLEGMA